MSASIFLARVFGIYFIIVCMAVIFHFKYIQAVYDDMVSNKAHVFIGAFLSLIIGILVVVGHTMFVWDWRLLITLIGYLALFKGILLLFFPEHMLKFKRNIMANKTLYYIMIIIFFAPGVEPNPFRYPIVIALF